MEEFDWRKHFIESFNKDKSDRVGSPGPARDAWLAEALEPKRREQDAWDSNDREAWVDASNQLHQLGKVHDPGCVVAITCGEYSEYRIKRIVRVIEQWWPERGLGSVEDVQWSEVDVESVDGPLPRRDRTRA
jgi:hypothetical protein